MNKKTLCKFMASFTVFSMVASTFNVLPVKAVGNNVSTYYVDYINGDDNNLGTSSKNPWKTLSKVNNSEFKPGDKILLKSGCVWNGEQLTIKSSGTAGNPIVLDKYGNSGEKPIINANGTADSALFISNSEYIEVNNLEITNDDDFKVEEKKALRKGIYVQLNFLERSVSNHIYIKNCYVHDVDGDSDNSKCTGGIIFEGLYQPGVTKDCVKFNDILVEGNSIKKVDRTGIKLARVGPNPVNTNVVVRNNMLEDIGGDGILIRNCVSPLVEYNTVRAADSRAGDSVANVAIWPWASSNSLFQYNEAYETAPKKAKPKDGQGFDSDYRCTGTTFQYNYSHDNSGGFMLVCSSNDVPGLDINFDTIIRYNISQNDKFRTFNFMGPASKNTKIYNNTIYTETPNMKLVSNGYWNGTASETYFYNNIFYAKKGGVFDNNDKFFYDNNCFYGVEGPYDEHKVNYDPQFVSPGKGKIGIDTLTGYMLKSTSPCIDTGKYIENNGGKDFFGNNLYNGRPDIGAHEYSSGAVGLNGTNVAVNKKVDCSTNSALSVNLVDDNTMTSWEADSSTTGQAITIDLEKNYNINGVRIYWLQDYLQKYRIQVSQDNNIFKDVYTNTNGKGNLECLCFNNISARYIRLLSDETRAGKIGINEIQVLSETAGALTTTVAISVRNSSGYAIDENTNLISNVPYYTYAENFKLNIVSVDESKFELFEQDEVTPFNGPIIDNSVKLIVTSKDGINRRVYNVNVNAPQIIGDTSDSFENGLGNWKPWKKDKNSSMALVKGNSKTGNTAIKLGAVSSIERYVKVYPNTTYEVTFHGKLENPDSVLALGVKNYGGKNIDYKFTSTDYEKGKIMFTTGYVNTLAQVYLYCSKGTAYGDDFSIRVVKNSDLPKITSFKINGENLSDFDQSKFEYTIKLPYGNSTIPNVKVESNNSKVNITLPDSIPGTAKVEVISLSDPSLVFNYNLNLVNMPLTVQPADMLDLTPVSVEASSEPQANVGNTADKTLDGNLNTRWASQGEQWIKYDLGKEQVVNAIGVASGNGDARHARFDIEVSLDGNNWINVFKGQSSGLTLEKEIIKINETNCRYVRINGHGNTVSEWNNITEVSIYAPNKDVPQGITVECKTNTDKLENNKNVNAEIVVINNTQKDENVLLVIGLYDENNKLLKLETANKKICAISREKLVQNLDLPEDTKGKKVKVFLWRGENLQNTTMEPLMEPTVID